MQLMKENVILYRQEVSYHLAMSIRQIWSFRFEASYKRMVEKNQNELNGMLDLLDVPPKSYRLITLGLKENCTKEDLYISFTAVEALFGESGVEFDFSGVVRDGEV